MGKTGYRLNFLSSYEFEIAPYVTHMIKSLTQIPLALLGEDLPILIKSASFIEQLLSLAQGKDCSSQHYEFF